MKLTPTVQKQSCLHVLQKSHCIGNTDVFSKFAPSHLSLQSSECCETRRDQPASTPPKHLFDITHAYWSHKKKSDVMLWCHPAKLREEGRARYAPEATWCILMWLNSKTGWEQDHLDHFISCFFGFISLWWRQKVTLKVMYFVTDPRFGTVLHTWMRLQNFISSSLSSYLQIRE